MVEMNIRYTRCGNSLLAGVVFQHDSGVSLRRNDRLRWMCGFDLIKKAKDVAGEAHNYTRFPA